MKIPTIILFTLLLSGCRIFLESSVINNCTSDTKIVLQYDKSLVPYLIDSNSFYKLIEKTMEGNVPEKIYIDSVNLAVHYILNPKDTFFIKPAIQFQKDTTYLISQISFINEKDTVTIRDYKLIGLLLFNSDSLFHPVKLVDCIFRDSSIQK